MLPNSTEATPQQPAGGAEQPTSQPSGSAEANPLLDAIKGLESRIGQQDALIKSLQSGNDKRFGKHDTDIKRILELSGQGLNETQIQRELFIDQLQQGQSAPQPAQPQGNGQPQAQTFDVDGVLKTLQFAENDPALAALKIKYSGNPQELVKAAADLRIQQFQSPNPSPATGLSQTGGQSGGAVDYDALAAEYETLSRNPAVNFERMSQIQTEMDKIK